MNPIANRIWETVKKECLNILAEDAGTPDQIDSAWLQAFGGKTIGPCKMMNSEGLGTTREEKNAPTLYFLDIAGEAIRDITKAGRTGRVLSGGFDGRPLSVIAGNQIVPDGIDISNSTGRIYWTNMGSPATNDGHINSTNLDGSDLQTVVAPGNGVHSPKQLVIDQMNDKLYFCDREGLRVMRCNLDGSSLETLVQTGDWHDKTDAVDQSKWCTGIAVDAERRHLYWTQKGPSKGSMGRIFRAGLNVLSGEDSASRSDVETLFQGLPECVDLDFDPETSQLYWSDRGELPLGNTINRAYVGSDRDAYLAKAHPLERKLGYTIVANQLHEAIGIKLDKVNKHIYVTDLGGTVYQFGLDGEGRKKAYEDMGVFTGLVIARA
jgi:DNA-binding beta-propeller fold protein YncE